MNCPQCGQQQVSDVVRFCSRCGFPLDGVIRLLANGGLLPVYQSPSESRSISPRRKGVRQGGVLLLAGAVVVPTLGVLNAFSPVGLDIFVALAAILFFVGGLMRMLYAALFEEGASPLYHPQPASFAASAVPMQLGTPARAPALPPPPANPAAGWKPRPHTAEMFQPPSVTGTLRACLMISPIQSRGSSFPAAARGRSAKPNPTAGRFTTTPWCFCVVLPAACDIRGWLAEAKDERTQ